MALNLPIFLRRNAALWVVNDTAQRATVQRIVIVARSQPEPTDLLAKGHSDSYNNLIMKKPQTVNK